MGLIGMWKAFDEMEALGWISSQAAEDDRGAERRAASRSCAPSSTAHRRANSGKTLTPSPPDCECPSRWAMSSCCDAIRKSGGTAIAVSDEELLDACLELGADEGIFAAPEGGACVAALTKAASERIPEAGGTDPVSTTPAPG